MLSIILLVEYQYEKTGPSPAGGGQRADRSGKNISSERFEKMNE
jgi:hypothetical protein